MRRLSIQLKVTLWFTLLMVLLVSIVLVFLFSLGAQSALEGTKSQMMDMVAAGWHEIGSDDGAIEIDDDLEYFKDGIYLSIYDAGGVPLYGAVPRDFDNSAVFAPNDLRTIPSGGKSWYVYDEQKQVYGYGTVWIRSVAEADQIDSTISTLFRFALIILPFFVLFAAVGGYLITRRAFRPVRRIIQTAKEIGEGDDLSRRIALGEGRDEIYTLAAEFDRMFARLEKAFETEKQFTSDASHELRTPTTVIISSANMRSRMPKH
ncbi:MAG: HAMP domain-containing protein [Anaeromassilibacillus sp.]